MANLNTLMIKAIKEFNRTHKGCDIMSIEPFEGNSKGKRFSSATFGIVYIDKNGYRDQCEIGVGA